MTGQLALFSGQPPEPRQQPSAGGQQAGGVGKITNRQRPEGVYAGTATYEEPVLQRAPALTCSCVLRDSPDVCTHPGWWHETDCQLFVAAPAEHARYTLAMGGGPWVRRFLPAATGAGGAR